MHDYLSHAGRKGECMRDVRITVGQLARGNRRTRWRTTEKIKMGSTGVTGKKRERERLRVDLIANDEWRKRRAL